METIVATVLLILFAPHSPTAPGLETSLDYGACIMKLGWGHKGLQGKLVMPWLRMHCEYFSALALFCACWLGLAVPPLGRYFWHAVCAAWKVAERGSIPLAANSH